VSTRRRASIAACLRRLATPLRRCAGKEPSNRMSRKQLSCTPRAGHWVNWARSTDARIRQYGRRYWLTEWSCGWDGWAYP